jgi:hypothetical protein
MSIIPFAELAEIFAPLEHLLALGGDTRLHIDPVSRLNGYGCRPYPRPEAFTFASSTATSISERAYRAAEAARTELIRTGLQHGLVAAVDAQLEALRQQLRAMLCLGDGVDIVFSPSGTDAELNAVFVGRTVLGTPMVSIITASDETGSGVPHASCGRHFNSLTAQGATVAQGGPIAGLAEDVATHAIPVRDRAGRLLPAEDIDVRVIDAVAQAVAGGRRVLLHAMDHSKLGRRCPSLAALRSIGERWGGRVQIVVDACQLRLGRTRLAWHLGHGHLVLITGSKFFTGPPFSGALLVPPALSRRMAGAAALPAGLRDYSGPGDWPSHWVGIRAALTERVNLGQVLRWVAAVEEMRAYFAVPDAYRRRALRNFADEIQALIAREPLLAPPDENEPASPPADDGIDDEEFALRTIFPFLMLREGTPISLAEGRALYRALNEDLAALLPASATAEERRIAAQPCHIGQPVAVPGPDGQAVAALRISAGARVVSETWSAAGEETALARLQGEFTQLRVIMAKVSLLMRHDEVLRRPKIPGQSHAA